MSAAAAEQVKGASTRRVYDAIDANNMPQARSLLNPLLKKYPKDHALRAANALLLLRQDMEQAKVISMELCKEDVTDDMALGALNWTLQQTSCFPEMVEIAKKLVAQSPGNAQALEQLALGEVRLGHYDAVQKHALTLAKQTSKSNYNVWAVMALVMQAPANDPKHMFLVLSNRMLTKVMETLTTPEIAFLYMEILRRQDNLAGAESFLLGAGGDIIRMRSVRLEALHDLYQEMSNAAGESADVLRCIARCNAIALHLIRTKDADNWTYWEWYLNSIYALATMKATGGEAPKTISVAFAADPLTDLTVHTTFPEALAVAGELVAKERDGGAAQSKWRRGPFMAQMEIHRRMGQPLLPLVKEYVDIFSSRGVCFLDVCRYLTGVKLADLFPDGAASDASAGHAMQKDLLRLSILLASQTDEESVANMTATVQECIVKYIAATEKATSLAWSEEGPGDGYLTAAAVAALQAFRVNKSATALVLGLSALSVGRNPKNNPGWQVLYITLSSLLGLAAPTFVDLMDLKGIQYDSMHHLAFCSLGHGFSLQRQQQWCTAAAGFNSVFHRDMAALKGKVFTHMNLRKLSEILSLERKVDRCVERAEALLASTVFQLTDVTSVADISKALQKHTSALQSIVKLGTDDFTTTADNDVLKTIITDVVDASRHQELCWLANPVSHVTECESEKQATLVRANHIKAVTQYVLLLSDVCGLVQSSEAVSGTGKGKKAPQPTEPDASPTKVSEKVSFDELTVCVLNAFAHLGADTPEGQGYLTTSSMLYVAFGAILDFLAHPETTSNHAESLVRQTNTSMEALMAVKLPTVATHKFLTCLKTFVFPFSRLIIATLRTLATGCRCGVVPDTLKAHIATWSTQYSEFLAQCKEMLDATVQTPNAFATVHAVPAADVSSAVDGVLNGITAPAHTTPAAALATPLSAAGLHKTALASLNAVAREVDEQRLECRAASAMATVKK